MEVEKASVLDESLKEKMRVITKVLKAHMKDDDIKLDWSQCDALKDLPDDVVELFCLVCSAGAGGVFKVDRRHYDKNIKIFCEDFKVLLGSHANYYSLQHFLLVHLDHELFWAKYIASKQYEKDIETLYNLIAVELPSEWNEDVLRDIKSSSCPIGSAEGQWVRYKDALRCLGMLYAPTFELNPYPGVFLHKGLYGVELGIGSGSLLLYDGRKDRAFQPKLVNCVSRTGLRRSRAARLDKNNKKEEKQSEASQPKTNNTNQKEEKQSKFFSPKTVNDLNQTWVSRFEALSKQLRQFFPVIKEDFTYNLDDMVNESGYYPYESFRYSCGAKMEEVPYQPTSRDMYYEPAHKTTWEAYAAEVLEPHLQDIFAKVIYKALGYDFTSEEFVKLYQGKDHASLYNEVCYDRGNIVTQAVTNLIQSICTACILTRHEPDSLYKVKVGVFKEIDSGKAMVRQLFQDTSFTHGNRNIDYEDGIVSRDKKTGLFIVEWTFCEDKETMDKRPLFGYEAARKFQIQGRRIDFNSMLLGEDKHGKALFSTPGGSIHIQDTVVHRFNAGSRSGKGVMTMNILASGLGSGALLFYIDRKPDMAAELAYITGGNMFLVNGGDVQSGEDVHQQYITPEGYGPQLERFGSGVPVCEPLKKVFGEEFGTRYEGAFGDFVYWKAMIFVLGIIRTRIELYKDSKDVRDEAMAELFRLDEHVMVVLDEITNWHNNMETQYFSNDPYKGGMDSSLMKFVFQNYGSEAAEISGLADAEEILADAQKSYNEAKAAKEEKDCDKTRAAFRKAAADLEKARDKVDKLRNEGTVPDKPSCLYWSTFYDKYQSIVDGLANINNAGYKNEMSSMNDVFMIGQKISGYPATKVEGDLLKLQSNGKELLRSAYSYCNDKVTNDGDKVGSFMLGFAEALRHDWFIGRNFRGKNKDTGISADFGGDGDRDLSGWLHERGNWAYVAKGGQEDYRTSAPAEGDVVCFKPYLVLNSNAEPEPEGGTVYTPELARLHEADEYKYVYGVAERVGIETWEKIRIRLLEVGYESPGYGHLHPGVGLRGLIEEYHRTTDPDWVFTSDCMCGSKEMADAICSYFGYRDYMEYLLDMSPKGIIGADDMLNLVKDKQFRSGGEYQLKKRFPRYFNTGSKGLLDGTASEAKKPEGVFSGFQRTASRTEGADVFRGFQTTTQKADEPASVFSNTVPFQEEPKESYGFRAEAAQGGTPSQEPIEFTTRERFSDGFLRQLAEWIVRHVAGAADWHPSKAAFDQAVFVAASKLRERGY